MNSTGRTIHTEAAEYQDKLLLPEVYYDSGRGNYWVKGKQGVWLLNYVSDVSRRLKKAGLKAKPDGDQNISDIEERILLIQDTKEVNWVGSLGGYKSGVHEIHGKRILVQDSPNFITPTPGEFPTIESVLINMLGEEQIFFFDRWLKVAIESLYSFKHRPGQALVLAGPRGSGKSLVQNLITQALGGRAADPFRAMTGERFNSELVGCEHLMIEDKFSSTKITDRLAFGAKLKEITANINQSAHAKSRQALTLTPFWRLSISLNSEPENLLILPPLNDHIIDKLIILKVEQHPMPMPTASDADREAFWAALTAELPHYISYLVNEAKIPKDYASERYGITHYQHPDIVQALYELTPEYQFLELLYATKLERWEGSSKELQQILTNHAGVGLEARRLLEWHGACGAYLGRLRENMPNNLRARHTKAGNIWTIDLPAR